jgi:hypothetical protein
MKQALPTVNSFCERHIGVPQPVSLGELLTNGHEYEGRAVSVSGYYSHGFEYSALYSDAGVDIYARDYTKGIWIEGLSPLQADPETHVLLTGAYTKKKEVIWINGQAVSALCRYDLRPEQCVFGRPEPCSAGTLGATNVGAASAAKLVNQPR